MLIAIDPEILWKAFCKSYATHLRFLLNSSECRKLRFCWFGEIKYAYEDIRNKCAKRNPGKQNWEQWYMRIGNNIRGNESEIDRVIFDSTDRFPTNVFLRALPSERWLNLESASKLIDDLEHTYPGIADPNTAQRIQIFRKIMLLQTEEMSAAAFQLGIEFEDIAGRTKTAKAENLVKRCDRNGQLPELRMLIDELIR